MIIFIGNFLLVVWSILFGDCPDRGTAGNPPILSYLASIGFVKYKFFYLRHNVFLMLVKAAWDRT